MKINHNQPLLRGGFFTLKNEDFLNHQRVAGKIAALTIEFLYKEVKSGTTNCRKLVSLGEQFILDNHCELTFKGFRGYPDGIIISLNKELVHGIAKDIDIKDGDMVSFDLGTTFNGSVADNAYSFVYGTTNPQYSKMLKTAEECLNKSIEAIKVNQPTGLISYTIFKHAKNNGFNVIEDYTGHGIGDFGSPHSFPPILNKSENNLGPCVYNGMSFAIEPLLIPITCSQYTKIGQDKWTVFTEEVGVHFEKTVHIVNDKVEVITDWRIEE